MNDTDKYEIIRDLQLLTLGISVSIHPTGVKSGGIPQIRTAARSAGDIQKRLEDLITAFTCSSNE